MQQLISIIIPIYNRVELLTPVLDSIKNQTYKNIEVIIVADGSTQIIPTGHQYPLINHKSEIINQLIRQENKGAPSARNRGLEEARGEYVIFWDADVIGRPDMLEKMYNALQENEDVSYSYCNHISYIIYHISKKMSARKFDESKLRENNYIHSTSLIRRKDVIAWDESLKRFQDWDLWLTMAEQGKNGIWIDEYLFTVLGGGTMSGWLPRIAYRVPFKWLPGIFQKVRQYEKAREIIKQKHSNQLLRSNLSA